MEPPTPFIWKGQSTATIGDLLTAACTVQDAAEAAEFMTAYRSHSEHADSNIGYILGYIEPAERRHELYERFQLSHPVFGGRP